MKRVLILGPECTRCRKLAENTSAAAESLGIGIELQAITDIVEILKFDISGLPALVVDGQVKLAGSVPSVEELKQFIR